MLCCPFKSWRNGLRTSEKQLRFSKEHWKMREYCTWEKLCSKSCINWSTSMFGTTITCSLSSYKLKKKKKRHKYEETSWNATAFVTGAILGFTCFEFYCACLKKRKPQKTSQGMTFHPRGKTGTKSCQRNRPQVTGCSSVLFLWIDHYLIYNAGEKNL